MNKKLLAACLIIAAFAVAPSLASANPILTAPTGTPLAAGAKFKGTNVGEASMVTSTGTLLCSTLSLTGTLNSNATATGLKGEIESMTEGGTGATAAGEPAPECTGSNFFLPNQSYKWTNLPWCLEAAAAADVYTIKGGKCGSSTAMKFDWIATGVGTCEYTRPATSPVNGTLVTHGAGANENTIAITNQEFTLVSGPGLCPSSGKLNMRFSLETDPGASIFIST